MRDLYTEELDFTAPNRVPYRQARKVSRLIAAKVAENHDAHFLGGFRNIGSFSDWADLTEALVNNALALMGVRSEQGGLASPDERRLPQVLNKRNRDVSREAVYIGRPSKWGNPFVIGRDGTREQVVERYRTWLLARPAMVAAARRELAGKNLVCFCAPNACHGDVLLDIANSTDANEHCSECDRLRAALRELVELRDLEYRISHYEARDTQQMADMTEDFDCRVAAAWDNAKELAGID